MSAEWDAWRFSFLEWCDTFRQREGLTGVILYIGRHGWIVFDEFHGPVVIAGNDNAPTQT